MKIHELLSEGDLGNALAKGLSGGDSNATLGSLGKNLAGNALGALGFGKTAQAAGLTGSGNAGDKLAKLLGLEPNKPIPKEVENLPAFSDLKKAMPSSKVSTVNSQAGVTIQGTNKNQLTLPTSRLQQLAKQMQAIRAKQAAAAAQQQANASKDQGQQADSQAQSGTTMANNQTSAKGPTGV